MACATIPGVHEECTERVAATEPSTLLDMHAMALDPALAHLFKKAVGW